MRFATVSIVLSVVAFVSANPLVGCQTPGRGTPCTPGGAAPLDFTFVVRTLTVLRNSGMTPRVRKLPRRADPPDLPLKLSKVNIASPRAGRKETPVNGHPSPANIMNGPGRAQGVKVVYTIYDSCWL
ncbi:hypothetical protein L218DRAFT_947876 [Marasmius fiardii PR-910]|nr:hypothetical protein L218DRAFT_947876 [Marasmius fiardii PR-910]